MINPHSSNTIFQHIPEETCFSCDLGCCRVNCLRSPFQNNSESGSVRGAIIALLTAAITFFVVGLPIFLTGCASSSSLHSSCPIYKIHEGRVISSEFTFQKCTFPGGTDCSSWGSAIEVRAGTNPKVCALFTKNQLVLNSTHKVAIQKFTEGCQGDLVGLETQFWVGVSLLCVSGAMIFLIGLIIILVIMVAVKNWLRESERNIVTPELISSPPIVFYTFPDPFNR